MVKTGRSSDARNTSHLFPPICPFLPIPSYLFLSLLFYHFLSVPSLLSLPIFPFSSVFFPSVPLCVTFLTPSSHLSLFICPSPSVSCVSYHLFRPIFGFVPSQPYRLICPFLCTFFTKYFFTKSDPLIIYL